MGRRTRRGRRWRAAPSPAAAPCDRRAARRARRRATCYCDGAARAAVHRERDQRRSGSSATPNADAVRQGRHQRLRRPRRARRGQPGAARAPRPRRTTRSTSAPGRAQAIRLRLTATAPPAPATRSAGVRRDVRRRGTREADEFYAADHPAVARRRRGQRHAPGAGRDALEQAVLLLRRRHAGCDEHGVRPARRRRAGRRRATSSGSTWSTTTSSRCRTSGSTPGTRPGTWPSTRSPLALVDPDFAKEQLELMLRERYLHPNGQIPAYEWNFGDVNPPVHAWATLFVYAARGRRRGEGDLEFLERVFQQAAAELHLVGQPQGPRRQATSSRAASSGSTTSASSTAARRCRPAATSSRPTARPGWRCSARTCCEIAVELALRRPGLRGHGAQVRRALPLDRVAHEPAGRRQRHVGRGGRLLLRRAAAARRQRRSGSRCARWSGCCRCARPRSSTADVLDAATRSSSSGAREFLERIADAARRIIHPPGRRASTAGACSSLVDETQAAPGPGADARRGRVPQPVRHPLALAVPRSSTPTSSTSAARSTEVALPAGRVGHRHVRRQLELARPGLDAGQRC